MKFRLMLGLLVTLSAAQLYAGESIDSAIAISSGSATTGATNLITIVAPSTGKTNCLTYAVFQSTSANQIYRILLGGTTAYQLTGIAANTLLRESWAGDPLCADQATAIFIKNSVGGSGTEFNLKGFVRR